MFGDYLARRALTPDGEPIETPTSRQLPVRRDGVAAMLKVAVDDEERLGNRLMCWWDGDGAARVPAHSDDAILLKRAESVPRLAELVRAGRDDEATRILCAVVARLHALRTGSPTHLVALLQWFAALAPAAAAHGGILSIAAATAGALLAQPAEPHVLHGDIHHDNVLWFAGRGWLAIDPKGLIGERGFDYANLFLNADPATAMAPGRFARRVETVAHAASLDRTRLLRWILAWGGLSSAWLLADGVAPQPRLKLAELALAELKPNGSRVMMPGIVPGPPGMIPISQR